MIEIRELAPGQLAEAADFAAQQFGCDISAAQPKLYGPRAAGSTYGAFIQGKMAGMLSVYGMTYRSLRWLSVGSVCCAPLYRGRGVMRALFSFLEREVYPQYDAVSLLGQRRLYERFGFAKVYPFLEYAFCFPAQQTECGVERLDRGCRDNDLFTLYQQYGKGPSRSPALFFETAATNGHAVYWLEEHGRAAYAACREDHHRITELCGTMPVEDACRLMAACWGATKVFYQAPLNVLDPVLCSQCDSYALSTRGNIRLLRPERVLVALAVPRVPEGAAVFLAEGQGFHIQVRKCKVHVRRGIPAGLPVYTHHELVHALFGLTAVENPMAALLHAELPSAIFLLDGI